jgi:hypothetical protein
MRVFRMFVVGMLIAGGMVMVAEAPGGSVPAASKSCKSLQALDKQLSKVVRSNNYQSSTISSLAKSFRDAAKSAPKSIKSAMNTIATVASDAAAAGSVSGAAAALRKDGTKLATAVANWGTYLSTNCAPSTASTSGSATFDARGCAAPTADQIGQAFGVAITKTTDTADNGCLWEGGSPSQAVQVSYHSPADFSDARIAILKAGATPVTVPGSNDAFVKHSPLPNAAHDIEYIVFPQGTVQIAFTGPSGFLTDQNESAVTQAIVG